MASSGSAALTPAIDNASFPDWADESDPRLEALWRRYYAHREPGDENRLAALYMGFSVNFAALLKRKWDWLAIDQDDAISAAMVALLSAVRTYNVGGPVPFRCFLRFKIKCQVKADHRDWRSARRAENRLATEAERLALALRVNLGREPMADELEAAMRQRHAERFAAIRRKGGMLLRFAPSAADAISLSAPAARGGGREDALQVADRSSPDPREAVADRELVDRVMAGLMGDERRVFRMIVVEGLNVAEAARELGVTRQAVWDRWGRLRARLATSPRFARLAGLDVTENGETKRTTRPAAPAAGTVPAAVAAAVA